MVQNRRGDSDTFDGGQYGTLRYDFKKWGGVQGVIPDPSDPMLEEFMRGMRDAAKEYQSGDVDVDNMSTSELQALMDDDRNLRISEAQEVIADLIGKLCANSPSKEMILALPFRVRQGFQKWLQDKLMSPEAEAADTRVSPVRRIGG